nr:MAG TPA: major capsid protein [Caudoviricetes sp.]
MPRITALNILLDTTGKEYLSELYGKTIEGVQKALISGPMKNMDLSGDPVSGTVEAKRFVNATSKAYGTARTAGKGDAVKAKPVTVAIDTDKEIVEELEDKDVRLYGVDGVLDRRSANHILRMAAELDNAFFAAAASSANALNMSGYASVSEELEAIIQECETTQNDFVDGVPRSMMHLILSPKYYGKVRNDLDKQTNNANVDTSAEEFYAWHGVRTYSCVHLPAGCDYLLMVDGSVAQPVMADQYTAEKIPLSNAYGVELFYHYGTKVVTPDLIFKKGVFTKATTYKAGTQYYTESNGVYTAVTISAFAESTDYYIMS